MQKKFLTSLIFIIFVNLLVKPFWIFGIEVKIQNEVGAAEYGFYSAIFSFTFLFNIILDLGINQFNNRNIARYNFLLNKYFSSIILIKASLAVVYLIVVFLIALISGYNGRAFYFLLFLAINQILLSNILYLRSNISALHLFKTDSLLSITDRILMIIFASMLLWGGFGKFQIEWFLYVQTSAYILTTLIAFMVLRGRITRFKLKINIPFLLLIIKKTYPFALLVALMAFYTCLDRVMLERMLVDGKREVGIYQAGYRILEASNMFAYLFATLLLPIFARMLKNNENVKGIIRTSFMFLIIPSILLVMSTFTYRKEIINTLYTELPINYTADIFGFIMLSFIPIASVYIFGTLLTANGNLKFLNIISLIGVLVNIGLNYFLILEYKALGSVLATLITQVLVGGVQSLKAIILFKIRVSLKQITKFVAFIVLIILSFYFYQNLFIKWYINALLLMFWGFIIAILLKLINLSSLTNNLYFNGKQ